MNPIYYYSNGVGGEGFFTSELVCHCHYKINLIICVSIHSVSNKEGTSISEVGEQALDEAWILVNTRSEN